MNRTLMIIVGAVAALVILVGIGIGVFLLMPTITGAAGANSPTPTSTAATIASNTGTPAPNKKSVSEYIRQYGPNVNQQLAQGLKLTPDQLTTQLRSGKTLTQVATDQKITAPQLNTLIATALQSSLQPAVTAGEMTQKQLATLVKHFQKNPDQLGKLLIAQPHKKGTPATQLTPTAQP